MINKFIGESTYEVTYRRGKDEFSFTTRGRSQREVRNNILTFFKISGLKIHDLKVFIAKEDFKNNLLKYMEVCDEN